MDNDQSDDDQLYDDQSDNDQSYDDQLDNDQSDDDQLGDDQSDVDQSDVDQSDDEGALHLVATFIVGPQNLHNTSNDQSYDDQLDDDDQLVNNQCDLQVQRGSASDQRFVVTHNYPSGRLAGHPRLHIFTGAARDPVFTGEINVRINIFNKHSADVGNSATTTPDIRDVFLVSRIVAIT